MSSPDLPAFSFYVDLDTAGDTPASLFDGLVAYSGGIYNRKELLGIFGRGEALICFDNVREERTRQMHAVRNVCETYPQCRFIFAATEDLKYSLSADRVPQFTPKAAAVLYLHPFGRKEVRLLTERWFAESLEECASKVEEVLSLLGRLGVPRSPFLISALLWIRERETHFSPVNQAEILDALIDGVMEKLTETKDRSHIDSTIKRHYLASLAEQLHHSGSKRISVQRLEQFTLEYFQSKALQTSTSDFLLDLKDKGILLEVSGEVAFLFDAIRAFFLASRFSENPSLLSKALSPEFFLDFGEEPDYFTGRRRDQAQTLQAALSLVESFITPEISGIPSDNFSRATVAASQRDAPLDASNVRITGPDRPTIERRNEILESIDDQVMSNSNVVRQPGVVDGAEAPD